MFFTAKLNQGDGSVEDMIKKLKMRFVLVNMVILTFVLFATLSSIYIMMSNSEIKVSNEIMDTLIENHKKAVPYNKNMHEPGKNGQQYK